MVWDTGKIFKDFPFVAGNRHIKRLKRRRRGDWTGGKCEGILATIEGQNVDGALVNTFPAFAAKL